MTTDTIVVVSKKKKKHVSMLASIDISKRAMCEMRDSEYHYEIQLNNEEWIRLLGRRAFEFAPNEKARNFRQRCRIEGRINGVFTRMNFVDPTIFNIVDQLS